MARPYWSGTIRFSLVSLPVKLYSAVNSASRLAMHMIHEPTGRRVRHQNVVEDVGPVPREEIIRGIQSDDGLITLTMEELADLKLESQKTIDIAQFVDASDIAPIYYDKPYYVEPDGKNAGEAYAVLREAMRKTKKVGIGQVAMSGKEKLVAIRPCGNGLIIETLRYEEEVKKASQFFEDIDTRVDKEMLELAETIIQRKEAQFDPSKYHDRYKVALAELIEAKRENREVIPIEEEAKPTRVVNLMDALKKSVEQSGRKAPAKKKSKKAA